jgi:hypothetical protein
MADVSRRHTDIGRRDYRQVIEIGLLFVYSARNEAFLPGR